MPLKGGWVHGEGWGFDQAKIQIPLHLGIVDNQILFYPCIMGGDYVRI